MRPLQYVLPNVLLARTRSLVPMMLPPLAVGIAAVCALWSVRQIWRYGVSVPFWDDWDVVDALRMFHAGELSWWQMPLLHGGRGEHQWPTIIALLVAAWQLTQMHIKVVMVWNWIVTCACCVLAAVIVGRAVGRRSPITWLALAASFFFVFNPAAFQVMLTGFPPVYTWQSLLFLSGVSLGQSRLTAGTKIVATGLLSLCASFIMINGLLFWVLLPAVVFRYEDFRQVWRRRTAVIVFGILLAVTVSTYAVGAFRPEGYAAPPRARGTVLDTGLFFLAYQGNFVSLSSSPQPLRLAQTVGALVVVLFIAAAFVTLVKEHSGERRSAALGWFAFALFWLLSAVGGAIRRSDLGVVYALDASRYVAAASFFVVATLVLTAFAMRQVSSASPRHPIALAFLALAGSALVLVGMFSRYPQRDAAKTWMYHSRYWELGGLVAAQSSNFLELPTFAHIFPRDDYPNFRRNVVFLNARGWLRPAVWDDRFVHRLGDLQPNRQCGELETVARTNGSVRLEGWAYLPRRAQRAHAIIVTAGQTGDDTRIVGVAFISKPRADVAMALRSIEALGTGWTLDVPVTRLARSRPVLRAFAYDAETGEACQTAGARWVPDAPST